MGSVLTSLSESPFQEELICYELQDNFSCIGERKDNREFSVTDDYQKQQDAFLKTLKETRKKNQNWLKEKFPFWDKTSVENLRVTYEIFALPENGMMDFQNL